MDEIVCITKNCLNKVDYFDTNENIWYCEKCAHTVSNPYGCTRILDASCIDLIISQCKKLLDRIKLYFNDEEQQLAIWSKYLEQLQSFEDEASEIKDELENSIKNNNLKNQVLMQHRSIDLKFRIIDSEAYRKYLIHKDMKELAYEDEKKENLVIDKTRINKIRIRTSIKKRRRKTDNQYLSDLDKSNPSINPEMEELKSVHSKEIKKLKQQQLKDKESYERDREEWLAQREEIEKELTDLKNKSNEEIDKSYCISYDLYGTLYKNILGKAKEFDSGAEIVFNLQNDKYMCLLGALKSFQLPQIKSFTFNNVPEDSELVKSFIENNIPIQSQFEFNKEKQVEIKGSKYLNAFKSAAEKTLDVFSINNTILSANELCEIISTAKYCKKLQFCFDFIEFDEELDFIENMEGCKIEYLSFNSSGSSYYSDWNQNPKRFVNIVVAISRCIPLSVSLKIINITNCGITEEDAVKILRNLHLNSIKIII